MGEIALALTSVLSRIQVRAGTRPVRLVAVSKTKPVEDLMEAHAAGQRHFGENYVRILQLPFVAVHPLAPPLTLYSASQVMELQEKSWKMPDDVRWHFIGHLQTNKVKKLLETKNLWVIETMDSLKLAKELNKHLEANKTSAFNTTLVLPLKIFIQVKTSDEESKSGVQPEECAELIKTIMKDMPNLEVCGLMTIGKLHGDPSEDFTLLKSTRAIVATTLNLQEDQLELSMGMSSDFETAVRPFRRSNLPSQNHSS